MSQENLNLVAPVAVPFDAARRDGKPEYKIVGVRPLSDQGERAMRGLFQAFTGKFVRVGVPQQLMDSEGEFIGDNEDSFLMVQTTDPDEIAHLFTLAIDTKSPERTKHHLKEMATWQHLANNLQGLLVVRLINAAYKKNNLEPSPATILRAAGKTRMRDETINFKLATQYGPNKYEGAVGRARVERADGTLENIEFYLEPDFPNDNYLVIPTWGISEQEENNFAINLNPKGDGWNPFGDGLPEFMGEGKLTGFSWTPVKKMGLTGN